MPESISTPSASRSASGPSTSHRKSGTPASRTMLSTLGSVQTRLRVVSSTTVALPVSHRRLRTHTLAVGRRGTRFPGRRRLVEMGRVADLSDQLLDDVLEGREAQGGAAGVDDPSHVRPAALERLERVVQGG